MYIKQGLITCIMGKNGMGKTTLLETIIGHHNPYLGHINYNGKNIEKLLNSKFESNTGMNIWKLINIVLFTKKYF